MYSVDHSKSREAFSEQYTLEERLKEILEETDTFLYLLDSPSLRKIQSGLVLLETIFIMPVMVRLL